jgi:hypothetical protein
MKIPAVVVSCDQSLYACIVEICLQSTELNHLLHFIVTHARVSQKLLQMCEKVNGSDCTGDGEDIFNTGFAGGCAWLVLAISELHGMRQR